MAKNIFYSDALTLNPSLLCQDGFEEALSYCELDKYIMRAMITDFNGLVIRVKPSFVAKDIMCAIKDHLERIAARKKRPLSLLRRMIETFFGYISYAGLWKMMKERKISKISLLPYPE